MSQKFKKSLAVLGIFLAVAVLISACATSSAQSPPATQVFQPTVIVTRLVTQIVATPTITPVPPPTRAVQTYVPAANTGWNPSAVPIYYPIRECVASRLYIGDVAFLASGSIGIHMSKGIGDAPVFRNLESGETIDIINGPWCDKNTIIWKVAAADGTIGFSPEGNGETYWLMPMPPTTERVLPKSEYKLREQLGPSMSPLKLMNSNKANYCR